MLFWIKHWFFTQLILQHGYVEKEKEQKLVMWLIKCICEISDIHCILQPPPPNILFESSYSTDEHNDDTEKDYFEESPPKEIPKKQSYFSPKICSICDMKFKNQKTLSKHVKHVHHKLKSIICQVCNKQFTRKSTLDVSKLVCKVIISLILVMFYFRFIQELICHIFRMKVLKSWLVTFVHSNALIQVS